MNILLLGVSFFVGVIIKREGLLSMLDVYHDSIFIINTISFSINLILLGRNTGNIYYVVQNVSV